MDERRAAARTGGDRLASLLADVQAGRLGRADLFDPQRAPSSALSLALLLEFDRQAHDTAAFQALCARLDGATTRLAARNTLTFLLERCAPPAGVDAVRDAALELWAAFSDSHLYWSAPRDAADALFALVAGYFAPTLPQARAALGQGLPRRAARLFKWLRRAGELPDADVADWLKALAFGGDPVVFWADHGELPPEVQGKKDAASIANLSLGVRNALEAQASARATRAAQQEHLEIARAQLEVSREVLGFQRRMVEHQERMFEHVDRSDAFRLPQRDKGPARPTTLADVKGIDEVQQEVRVIVDFLREPASFARLGARVPGGVLLVGRPGTGKTLLARAIAGEANASFFALSGSDFVEVYVGVGAARVRNLFARAKENAPSIVFIDEIDAIGRHRGDQRSAMIHEEREQTLNQLLAELDGFESTSGIIVIAATNRPDVLDPALLRPGRFDRHIVVPCPDRRGRAAILAHHIARRSVPVAADVDLSDLARGLPGWSGADLENLVNEAALAATLAGCAAVAAGHFRAARERIALGLERRSLVLGPRERRTAACHEAGHALVAILLPDADPVEKVSILPRGQTLGHTWQVPPEDRLGLTRAQASDAIAVAFGGRAAEELLLDQQSSGVTKDLEIATNLARRMVCEWGMSDLGPLSFAGALGSARTADLPETPDCSARTAAAIDDEVRRIVLANYQRAASLLQANRVRLEALAEALLERETLSGAEIDVLLAGGKLDVTPRVTTFPSLSKSSEQLEAQREAEAKVGFPLPSPTPEKA